MIGRCIQRFSLLEWEIGVTKQLQCWREEDKKKQKDDRALRDFHNDGRILKLLTEERNKEAEAMWFHLECPANGINKWIFLNALPPSLSLSRSLRGGNRALKWRRHRCGLKRTNGTLQKSIHWEKVSNISAFLSFFFEGCGVKRCFSIKLWNYRAV